MNTTQLECFTEVANELSFSRAARNLHLSQPTVSHQVSSLEEELGVQLLARSTRSVRLTEAGHAFLGYASEIVDLVERSKRQVTRGRRQGAHTLKIGVHDGMEARLMAPSLRALRAEVADIDPVVRMAPASVLRTMLEDGIVDLVPEYREPDGEPSGATSLKPLFECEAVLVCAPDHALAARGRLRAEELSGIGRMVVGDPRHCASAIVDMQRKASERLAPDDIMMGYNTEIALALAETGVACTVQADIPAMHMPSLRYVPIEDLRPAVFGVRVRRGRRAALLERFTELLGEKLRQEPERGAA